MKGHALADYRDVPIVGIARVGHEQVGTGADGFAHAGVQLPRGRVDEAQFQLCMAVDAHRAPGRVHAALEVFAVGEGIVLETRARQGHARGDAAVELGADHEQVVVPGFRVDVPGFALDQIAQHVVGHSRA
ncbi:hypothetical protein D9M71_280770 [compost metagenome]